MFRLEEYIKSHTAKRYGIDNTPKSLKVVANLETLHNEIILKLKEEFKDRLVFGSVYRCLELNRKIGSKDTSDHVKGRAVDFEVLGMSNRKLFEWCQKNIPSYDQLILEFHKTGKPSSGWVHISFRSFESNRKMILEIGCK